MTKIVVNRCFGGFSLSDRAIEMYLKLKGKNCFRYVDNYKPLMYTFQSIVNDCDTVYYSTKFLGQSFVNWPDNHEYFSDRNIVRDDLDLITVVEQLGKEASGLYANLKVVEIPDHVNWEIESCDGQETIHEVHQSW